MKDRVRIMLGSREIVKRYIGDRLVWSGGTPVLFEGSFALGSYRGNYYIGPIKSDKRVENMNFSAIKAFQIEGKDVFKLTRYEFKYLYNNYIGISIYEPGIQEYFDMPPNYKDSKTIKIKLYGE